MQTPTSANMVSGITLVCAKISRNTFFFFITYVMQIFETQKFYLLGWLQI